MAEMTPQVSDWLEKALALSEQERELLIGRLVGSLANEPADEEAEAVSKLERRADMYVSTLQSFVKAMGGELKITARFPEGTVEINQFEDVKKAAE